MPFQSEKQRRYLWANEPEIARDWTDTYGSRIEAALGGIMALAQGGRIGFKKGDGPAGGASAGGNYGGDSSGGDNQGAGGGRSEAQGGQFGDSYGEGRRGTHHGPINPMLGAPPGLTTTPGHTPTKGFFGNLASGIWDAYTTISPTYNAFQFAKKAFTPQTPQQKLQANINKGYDVNNPAEMHAIGRPVAGPTRDGGNNPYITPYLNDVYAQNVMEEDGLDIDTSTGNMEDWSQRFRVGNQYRQDKEGQLDPQIREMINKLYT